ncbi:MAG: PilN domain-containing protein [Phycisphaerales bacterium]|nr:PilN domain-containing protein [Phycisphaerales bacterium]
MTNHTPRPDMGGSFLPEEFLARRAELRAGVLGLVLFGVVMALVVGAFLVTNQRWRSVRADARAVEAEYEEQKLKLEQLDALEHDREEMLEKAEIVSALVEKTPRSLLMSELVSRMPPGMTMLEVKLDGKRVEPPKSEEKKKGPQKVGTLSKGKADPKAKVKGKEGSADAKGKPAVAKAEPPKPARERIAPPKFDYTMTITGVSPVNSEVTDFLTKLTECELVQNVDLVFIQETDIGGLPMRKFEITAQLRPGGAKTAKSGENQMATVETEQPTSASGKE